MAIIEKKNLEEHKAYVEQMCRISFFFVRRWMKECAPEKHLGELLRDHTPLFFHALNYLDYENKWNNPDGLRIIMSADKLQNLSAQEFEDRMYAEIKELAMERAELFYPESVGVVMPKDWNVRSLKYDSPKPSLPRNYCCFHIANALAPYSFYNDPRHLPECFLELMSRSEKEYGYDTLYTATWLNDNPHWLKLFPGEWYDNLTPRTNYVGWDFGYWGQLVTARGTFNEKAGQYVRQYGELKYKTRASHCSFAVMRNHIENIIG